MPPVDPLIGQSIGRYRIESKLGQGGMGAVYLAQDQELERPVALKLLPPRLAAEEEFKQRFLREARKLARLAHANIVQIYELGTSEGHTFMAMQLMDGGSLQDRLTAEGRLSPEETARIGRDAARGLARAARDNIIHRDIKPANILLGLDGEVRLGDFGLVKQVGEEGQPLTQTGVVLGTPHYMAPEQCEGREDIDHRADLYALGLVLYQCVSGVLPATGKTPLQIIYNRLEKDLPPLRDVAKDVPPELAGIVEALLVRDPDARLQTAEELAERLDGLLQRQAGPATAAETVHIQMPATAAAIPVLPIESVPTARLVRGEEPGLLPTVAHATPVRSAGKPPTGRLVGSTPGEPPAGKRVGSPQGRPPSGRLITDDDDLPRRAPPATDNKALWIVVGCLLAVVGGFFLLVVIGVLANAGQGGY